MGRGMPPDMFGQFPRPGELFQNFIDHTVYLEHFNTVGHFRIEQAFVGRDATT
jgi:hypothetical protein